MSKTRQEVTVTWTGVVIGGVVRNDWILDIGELVAFAQRLEYGPWEEEESGMPSIPLGRIHLLRIH